MGIKCHFSLKSTLCHIISVKPLNTTLHGMISYAMEMLPGLSHCFSYEQCYNAWSAVDQTKWQFYLMIFHMLSYRTGQRLYTHSHYQRWCTYTTSLFWNVSCIMDEPNKAFLHLRHYAKIAKLQLPHPSCISCRDALSWYTLQ